MKKIMTVAVSLLLTVGTVTATAAPAEAKTRKPHYLTCQQAIAKRVWTPPKWKLTCANTVRDADGVAIPNLLGYSNYLTKTITVKNTINGFPYFKPEEVLTHEIGHAYALGMSPYRKSLFAKSFGQKEFYAGKAYNQIPDELFAMSFEKCWGYYNPWPKKLMSCDSMKKIYGAPVPAKALPVKNFYWR